MSIPSAVETKLSEDLWKRAADSDVSQAFKKLSIDPTSDFGEFFTRFWGPFHSRKVGHELLDIVEQEETIVSATVIAREEFGFEECFVVVSTLNGMSVLVYDVETDRVFDVDFEGGEELLQTGDLDPRWNSWNEFAIEYFG